MKLTPEQEAECRVQYVDEVTDGYWENSSICIRFRQGYAAGLAARDREPEKPYCNKCHGDGYVECPDCNDGTKPAPINSPAVSAEPSAPLEHKPGCAALMKRISIAGYECDCGAKNATVQDMVTAATEGAAQSQEPVATQHVDHVAWVRYRAGGIQLCDSDAYGAFKVYRLLPTQPAAPKDAEDRT